MSFGGAVSAMVTSIKNNKRKRPSAFENINRFEGDYNTQLQFNKKATPHQLEKIRTKLQEENRKRLIKYIVLLTIVISVVIYLIGFVEF